MTDSLRERYRQVADLKSKLLTVRMSGRERQHLHQWAQRERLSANQLARIRLGLEEHAEEEGSGI